MEFKYILSILLLIVGACSKFYFGWSNFSSALLIIFIWSLCYRRLVYIIIKTLPRDIKGIFVVVKLEKQLNYHFKNESSVDSIFTNLCRQSPNKVALINCETGEEWTFQRTREYSNQIANFFHSEGFREGDTVALFMANCPEYVCFWLGLSKIGVVTALINYNLRTEALRHSINVAKAKAIIVDSEHQNYLTEVSLLDTITSDHTYVFGDVSPTLLKLGSKNITDAITNCSKISPAVKLHKSFKNVLFYIYTSGTTGLPKAAIITHARYFMMGYGAFCAFGLSSSDRHFIALPLYHSAAGILGTSVALLGGGTIVIKKKFSASRFWDDCIRYDCTASQYIGEICRYLLAQPFKASERQHKVRVMFGNGLRPQIWEDFTSRFGISRIGELYGSTEGNNSLLNLDNTVGSCGFIPIYPFIQFIYPIAIIRVDETTGQHIRNKDGFCIRCKPGETGEIIASIVHGNPLKDFQGYLSNKDTSKKVIRDVFKKGDAAFSSGDILHMDEFGYLFFKDRTGDTYRWKGENVSTSEVEAVIHKIVGLNDATVYGVFVPGSEGKAGMAAIVDDNQNIDLSILSEAIHQHLPAYARPVFLRICKAVDTTGTFKLKKTDLQKAAFNPALLAKDENLYFLNSKTRQYEQLTDEIYQMISSSKMQF